MTLVTDTDEYRNLFREPEYADAVVSLKTKLVGVLTGDVSGERRATIRKLFDNSRASEMRCMESMYKWDAGIIEGGGFWVVHRDGSGSRWMRSRGDPR